MLAGLAFYGGMSYGKNLVAPQVPSGQMGSRDFGGQAQNGMARRGAQSGGFTGGEIVSKDDKSLTVKLRDGSSKIVFLSSSSEILKFVSGTLSDLQVGEQVAVTGSANNDGSITAQSIQVRPQIIKTN